MMYSSTMDLINAREVHTATLLKNGSVSISGGQNIYEAELFHAENGSRLTGEMRQPRWFHTAIRLNSRNVLIIGGTDGNRTLKTTETYHEREGRFITGADMKIPRLGHTTTLLPNGCVIVIGGLPKIGQEVQATDLVEKNCPDGDDNVANNFVTIGRLQEARAYHTATLLDSTKILVVGGKKISVPDREDILKSLEVVPVN